MAYGSLQMPFDGANDESWEGIMPVDEQLISHPIWEATDPANVRLVRVSAPLPELLNPFFPDGVVLYAAGIPGEVMHSKSYVGRAGIHAGVRSGAITRDTTVVEATSGNTGQSMAAICSALGIKFLAIVSNDVPQDKINALRILPGVSSEQLSSGGESTVERARRLGTLQGFHNPDQYANIWNPEAHYEYLAPQLFAQTPFPPALIVVPAGTMGTGIGLSTYIQARQLHTGVVGVMCSPDEEIPGARTLAKIERDVLLSWQGHFHLGENIEFGPRHEAFYLSLRSWACVPQMLGPSFGLAYYGALKHLLRLKRDGALDQMRAHDGRVHVVVFGPDDNRPYYPLYFGELKTEEFGRRGSLRLDELGIQ